jgi:hypothetical protein
MLEKVRQNYRVSEELMEKSRSYLINQNARQNYQLQPNEEGDLLAKFNEELRSSTFFLIEHSDTKISVRW